ncbi:MAG: phosphoribosylglycinamide formyltransferase [bacterium]
MAVNIAIFISGRGSNMESLLRKSEEAGLDIKFTVVSDNADAEGLRIAEKMGVKTIFLENCANGWKLTEENAVSIESLIRENRISRVFLAGFMRIIPESLIKKHPLMFVNIHPSLLPSFKGKEAQKDAFEYGVKVSGCTVHFVDEGVDTGPIIMQKSVDISDCTNTDEVKSVILETEHLLYFQAMRMLLEKNFSVEGRRVIFGN